MLPPAPFLLDSATICVADDWMLVALISDAIEGADVMLYGVSLAYKESSNCRMEANCESHSDLKEHPSCGPRYIPTESLMF